MDLAAEAEAAEVVKLIKVQIEELVAEAAAEAKVFLAALVVIVVELMLMVVMELLEI